MINVCVKGSSLFFAAKILPLSFNYLATWHQSPAEVDKWTFSFGTVTDNAFIEPQ